MPHNLKVGAGTTYPYTIFRRGSGSASYLSTLDCLFGTQNWPKIHTRPYQTLSPRGSSTAACLVFVAELVKSPRGTPHLRSQPVLQWIFMRCDTGPACKSHIRFGVYHLDAWALHGPRFDHGKP